MLCSLASQFRQGSILFHSRILPSTKKNIDGNGLLNPSNLQAKRGFSSKVENDSKVDFDSGTSHMDKYLDSKIAKQFYLLAIEEGRISQKPSYAGKNKSSGDVAKSHTTKDNNNKFDPCEYAQYIGKIALSKLDVPILPTWIPADSGALNTSVPLTAVGESVRNDNWRSRCYCSPIDSCSTTRAGNGFMHLIYGRTTTGRSKYEVRLGLWDHHASHWGVDGNAWNRMVNSHGALKYRTLYQKDGNHPGEGSYYSNVWDSGGSFARVATISVQVFKRGASQGLGTWLYNPAFNETGYEWLHCGKDISFYFEDR